MTDEALTLVKSHVTHFLDTTADARLLQERDRDYYDHKQWTDEEVRKLAKRNQAPIIVNRVKPKVEGLIGLYMLRNSDPKGYPRTKKHEKASEAVTDGLRYVADDNDFPFTKMMVAGDFFVEGYGGCLTDVRQKKNGEIEIKISHIPWDRIYFDPHSRALDFSDSRYFGIVLWMDEDQVREQFPDANVDELLSGAQEVDETFEDRPRWYDRDRKRVRVAMEFYQQNGWKMCVFNHGGFLVPPQESPFLDDEGEPSNPIELVSANVDRDNMRYGEVRGFISQQDEINHRRSKALHLMSSRQTFGRKGAVKDIPSLKRELAKPDGHVEFDGDKFGDDFGVLPTSDMLAGQVELYQDAKAEIDAQSFNAQLAGERQSGDLSGIAIQKLQAAGTMELNRQFELLKGFEKRVYRQIWSRIKQFWTEEKWIRVTDDQDALRWVGFNTGITAQTFLEETINDDSAPLMKRKQAAAAYTHLMQNQPEALEQIVGSQNDVSDLDVDIILDQSFDNINTQQEQFKLLAQFAQGADIDIIELIELSELRGKDELIEKIEKRRQEAAQAAGQIPAEKGAELMLKKQMHDDTMVLEREKIQAKRHEKAIAINVGKEGDVETVSGNSLAEEDARKAELQFFGQMAGGIIESVNALKDAVTAPKQIVRGPDGKAAGVVPAQ